MPPKKTPVKTPEARKKIVAAKGKNSRNSLTAKTPKISNAKNATPKKPIKAIPKAKRGKASEKKSLTPVIQDMKIKLANEVVQAQFPKQRIFENIKAKPIKKPVLKRKQVQNKKNDVNLETGVHQDPITLSDKSPVAKKRPRMMRKSVQDVTVNGTDVSLSQSKLKPKTTPRRNSSLNRKKKIQGLARTIVNDYMPESNAIDNNNKQSDVSHTEVNENTNEPILIKTENENSAVNSRRSSDIGSGLSWTKDLSSSSTTTCVTVTSNDIVRFNNKLPFVKLIKYDALGVPNNVKENTSSSSSSSDTSSTSSSSTDKAEFEIATHTVILSSPSSSEKSSVKKISIYDTLLEVLKTFNPDKLDWSSWNEHTDTDKFKEQLKKENVFQDETSLISQWLEITNLESEWAFNKTLFEDAVNCDSSAFEGVIELTDDRHSAKNVQNESKKRADEDDDDALSLFAESISGFDISRKSCSLASTEPQKTEEYVPQPVVCEVFKLPQAVTYNPSKITDIGQITNRLSVCEKQNADSTSIRNEFDADIINNFETSSESSKSENEVKTTLSKNQISISYYTPVQLIKSAVLRGVCAFNLLDNCKKIQCHFPHTHPDPMLVQLRLQRLPDNVFIREYLLIRNLGQLRSEYGLYFIEECIKRKLSRVLLQMSYDFVVKASEGCVADEKLKTEAVESTLLYFNLEGLSEYEDLLQSEVKGGVLLCDVFLQVIGRSQNFSRFRTVFINLTMFMCRIGRVFDSNVACQVLERVCILPYEFSLNRTLIEILKRTDRKVFANSMSGHLDERLLTTNRHLYDEFVKIKRVKSNESGECQPDKDIRYSPDTTNYDTKVTRHNEIGPLIVNQTSSTNKYNKKPFKTRWNQSTSGSNFIFKRKPIFQRPVNSLFASPSFSPSQNPGNILSKLNRKV